MPTHQWMPDTITFYQRREGREDHERDIWIVFAGQPPHRHALGAGWPAISLLRPAWTTSPCQWFFLFDLPHYDAIGEDGVARLYPEIIPWLEGVRSSLRKLQALDDLAQAYRASLGPLIESGQAAQDSGAFALDGAEAVTIALLLAKSIHTVLTQLSVEGAPALRALLSMEDCALLEQVVYAED